MKRNLSAVKGLAKLLIDDDNKMYTARENGNRENRNPTELSPVNSSFVKEVFLPISPLLSRHDTRRLQGQGQASDCLSLR